MYDTHIAQWMVTEWTHPCPRLTDQGRARNQPLETPPVLTQAPTIWISHTIDRLCLFVCFINMDCYTCYLVWLFFFFLLKGEQNLKQRGQRLESPPPPSLRTAWRELLGVRKIHCTRVAVRCYCNRLYYFVKYFYKYLRGVHICNIRRNRCKEVWSGASPLLPQSGQWGGRGKAPPYLYIGLCATTKLNLVLNFSMCCCCLNIV